MDAPRLRLALLAAALMSMGASYRTPNFIINAPTQDAAEQIGRAAEKFRRELAVEWLGQTMPNWSQPCPITAQVGEQLGAGGATSFVFEHGEVFGWRMTIQGSLLRILDSVLPHEVTHTIFATHFRQPLPRWADEGACTTVEHVSERAKQQTMLVDFLKTNRGIAFSRMFVMKDYPQDVMPLYSQGYSLARYLISQGGKHKFLDFVGDGLRDEDWTRAIKQHYGVQSLAALQDQWLDWVKKGSKLPENTLDGPAVVAVKSTTPAKNTVAQDLKPNRNARSNADGVQLAGTTPAPNHDGPSVYEMASTRQDLFVARSEPSPGKPDWRTPRPTQDTLPDVEPKSARADGAFGSDPPIPSPLPYQVTRPQPVERPRQVILEWSK